MLYAVILNDEFVGNFDAEDEAEALRLARVGRNDNILSQRVERVIEEPEVEKQSEVVQPEEPKKASTKKSTKKASSKKDEPDKPEVESDGSPADKDSEA